MKKLSYFLVIFIFASVVLSACVNVNTTDVFGNTTKKPDKNEKTYLVTFYSNGGSNVESMLIPSKTEVNFPEYPTKPEYEFKGWYIDNNTFQTRFDNKYLMNYPLKNDLTVYAKWEVGNSIKPVKEIKVSAPTKNVYILGEELNLAGSRLTLYYYDNSSYTSDTKIEYISGYDKNLLGEQTILVSVKANREVEYVTDSFKISVEHPDDMFKIKFVSNGGTEVEDYIKKYDAAITFPTSERLGFGLIGWCIDPELKTLFTFGVMPKENLTLYAKWEKATPGLIYRLHSSSTLYEVYGYTGTEKDVTIPQYYNGKLVTRINSLTFSSMLNVEIVNISKAVVTIDSGTFANKSNLKSINVHEENEKYSSIDGNLYNKEKTELLQYSIGNTSNSFTIPNTVEKIAKYAFHNSKSLVSVIIPSSVTEIDSQAFYYCRALKTLDCSNNNKFIFEDGILYNKEKTILVMYLLSNTRTAYEIPETIQTIGDSAFQNNYTLQNVTLNENLKIIGKNAFSSTLIKNIELSDKLEELGEYAFNYSELITSFVIPNSLTKIGKGAFANTGVVSVEIPEHITMISDSLFSGCQKLQEVKLHRMLTAIGNNAFQNTKLSEIKIYASTLKVGDYAFSGVSTLFKIEIESGLAEIGKYAFAQTRFDYIDLPKTITSIGDYAFAYSYLKEIILPEKLEKINSSVFYENLFLEKATLSNSITSIGSMAFYKCEKLVEIVIPYSVKTINSQAFYSNLALERVTFETLLVNDELKGIETISSSAFYDCKVLKEVILPETLTKLETQVFYNNEKLARVVFPESLKDIGSYAFYNCKVLTKIDLPKNIVEIGYNAFYNCTRLATVVIMAPEPFKLGSSSFDYTASALVIYVPNGCLDKYRTDQYWKAYSGRIKEMN